MMARSPLFGRRIHIAGSISDDLAVAPTAEVTQAREVVEGLARELLARGATFVLPVDAEKTRAGDGLPICFDWLVWRTLYDNLMRRPSAAPNPLAIAVEHHKTEEQVPAAFQSLWDRLRGSDLIQIENVSHWNMNSKRMEAQARWGDILVALGGAEGVLFLANLYHDAGRPVVPLNAAIVPADIGARRLFSLGLSSVHAPRLFKAAGVGTHTWINRTNFTSRTPVAERVKAIIDLLEALERPAAFVVRLLDPEHADYSDVQSFFDTVVQPVIENELGYRMVIVDGRQPHDHARLDQEIFAKLHRSSVVVADITGMRPNCFLELGYALGRGLPTMLMVKEGSSHPFDITTFAALHWKTGGPVEDRRRAFREHWAAIQSRPPLVPMEPLIS
jgi:TIR- and PNP-associating SLOG family